jgi:DNA (cytosine-5)-methyltransferase 1
MNKVTMVDLFCGAGIGALGFKQAGYDIIWAIDNNKHAVNTYNENIGNHAVLKDIRKIDISSIPYADVIAGGFPCKPFSLSGKGEGEKCKINGNLSVIFSSIIKQKQPKAFILENVGGITSVKHKKFFSKIIDTLKRSGYNVEWKIVNCWELGVPQLRKRVFAIGIRKDLDKKFIFPEALPMEQRTTIRTAISDLPKPYEYGDKENNIIRNHYVKEAGYSTNYLSRNRQKQWDEPSFTIVSSCRHLPLYPEPPNFDIRNLDKYKIDPPRRFTVRECLRLQSVPDEFFFDDQIPIKKQYERCSGIPTIVAYKISKILKNLI